WPWAVAKCSGLEPASDLALIEAPLAISTSTIAVEPSAAARCSGVRSKLSLALMTAPHTSKSSTIAGWRLTTAQCDRPSGAPLAPAHQIHLPFRSLDPASFLGCDHLLCADGVWVET